MSDRRTMNGLFTITHQKFFIHFHFKLFRRKVRLQLSRRVPIGTFHNFSCAFRNSLMFVRYISVLKRPHYWFYSGSKSNFQWYVSALPHNTPVPRQNCTLKSDSNRRCFSYIVLEINIQPTLLGIVLIYNLGFSFVSLLFSIWSVNTISSTSFEIISCSLERPPAGWFIAHELSRQYTDLYLWNQSK